MGTEHLRVVDGRIDVPGGAVWWARYGDHPHRPPVLCLHGGPGTPAYYLEPLLDLAGDRDLIVYDQLGCGRSDRPDDISLWTLERSLTELETVRLALGLQQFHLFGHSWGGALALAYAVAHPESLLTLVCASPLVSVSDWLSDAQELLAAFPPEMLETLTRHEAAGSTDDPDYQRCVDMFYRRHFCRVDPWPECVQKTFAEMNQQVYETMWGVSEFSQSGNLAGLDLSPRLGELAMPSLWTCGKHDEARPSTIRRYAEAAPASRFGVIPDASHCAHVEFPERYLTVLREFYAEPPSEGRS